MNIKTIKLTKTELLLLVAGLSILLIGLSTYFLIPGTSATTSYSSTGYS